MEIVKSEEQINLFRKGKSMMQTNAKFLMDQRKSQFARISVKPTMRKTNFDGASITHILKNHFNTSSKNRLSKFNSKNEITEPGVKVRTSLLPVDAKESAVKSILNAKMNEKLVDNIEEKKETNELNNLKAEIGRLRKALEFSKDAKALAFVTKKFMRVNARINKIIKIQEARANNEKIKQEQTEEDAGPASHRKNKKSEENSDDEDKKDFRRTGSLKHKKSIMNKELLKKEEKIKPIKRHKSSTHLNSLISSSLIKKEFISNLEDINNKMKENQKNMKINKLLIECQLMENRDKFLNKKVEEISNSHPNFFFLRKETENNLFLPSTDIRKADTLLQKSYRPKGFRTRPKTEVEKVRTLNPQTSRCRIKSIDEIIFENKSNKILQENNNNKKTRKDSSLFLTSNKIDNDPNSKEENHNKFEMIEKFKKLFVEIFNDSLSIKKQISEYFRENKINLKDDDFTQIAMNYATKYDTLEKIKNQPKKYPTKNHEEKAEIFINKLKQPFKHIMAKSFKRLYEGDRHLNKDIIDYSDGNKTSNVLRMKRTMRKVAWDIMFLLGEKIDNEKEDIEKIYKNQYNNVDYLEWQVKKEQILKVDPREIQEKLKKLDY